MSDRELNTTTSRPVSDAPVIADDNLPCIVIFVAGEPPRVETAIHRARQLYPDRHRIFICEPAHRDWISPAPGERMFVVEQPFNPFGRTASELRRCLESSPIEACALVIAGVGLESLRFRVFALRLRTQRFRLLGGDTASDSKQLDRLSFALLTGVTLPLGRLRKIEGKVLAHLRRIAALLRDPRDLMSRSWARIGKLQDRTCSWIMAWLSACWVWLGWLQDRIRRAYDTYVGVWLQELQEAYDSASGELSALTEEALAQAVEVQRLSGMERARGTDNVKHKLKTAAASLGIRQLDKRYRQVFQDLFSEPGGRFDSVKVSADSITLVIGTLGPGGSERQAATTLMALASRDCRNLALLCNHLDGPVDRFYSHLLEGCSISISELYQGLRDTNHGEGNKALTCAELKALMEKLPAELKDIPWYAQEFLATRPKVVHAWLDYTNVKAGLAAALIGVPRIVLSTRSVAPNNFALFQPYMREAYRLLAARPTVCLLNNSQAGARNYERWLGLRRGTFKVVRNGFDFSKLEPVEKREKGREFRTRLGIPTEAALVGSVLRFSEEKCPLLWIDTAARVAERRADARFLMVGDGPLREEARRRARARGLGDRIVMPGNEKDAAIAIAAMDVFLLTSRLEGLPNVLIEAQALGVPVVTTDGGGAAETLIQGKTGYAVRPHSTDLLANAILRILSDTPWREAARQTSQRFVRERFSMSQMVDRTLDAYFARGEFAAMQAANRRIANTLEATY
jgi:glycosyltransferase involved in cell wall biosynthesis